MFMASLPYNSAKIIRQAIQKSMLKGERVKEQLCRISLFGISQPLIEFDENGDLNNPSYEVRVIENKQSYLYD